jgi:integrase
MSEQLIHTKAEPPNMRRSRRGLRGQKPPLKVKEIWAIRIRLQLEERIRDLAMFNLAIDSKLRACDLTALKVDDVAMSGRVKSRAIVIQKKTGRPVQFEITEQTRIRLLAGSIRLDFVRAVSSSRAAFVPGARYLLASTPDWSHDGSPHSALTLRVTGPIRCGERNLH